MKNIESFHEQYIRKKKQPYEKTEKYDVWNAFPIDNPIEIVDCTPDGNYDNFKHVVGGDQLLYCEFANSTPFEEHSISEECEQMVYLNSRINCAFGMDDIDLMKNDVIGKSLWRMQFQVGYPNCKIGDVIDADTIDDTWDGIPYRSVAILCWTSYKDMKRYTNEKLGMTYLGFNLLVSNEICCECGESFKNGYTCDHIKKRGLEIVKFAQLKGFAYVN